jgi:hypothetical protein
VVTILMPHIISQLATADQANIVVSFALESGVDRVFEHSRDLLERGGQLRILTGDYLGITEPNALMRLLDLEGRIERRIFETAPIYDGSAICPVSSSTRTTSSTEASSSGRARIELARKAMTARTFVTMSSEESQSTCLSEDKREWHLGAGRSSSTVVTCSSWSGMAIDRLRFAGSFRLLYPTRSGPLLAVSIDTQRTSNTSRGRISR